MPEQTPFVPDTSDAIDRPREREEWKHNQNIMIREWGRLLVARNGLENMSAMDVLRFHADFYMLAGHKAPGRLYVAIVEAQTEPVE